MTTKRVAVYVRHTTDLQDDSPGRQLSLVVPYIRARPRYLLRGSDHAALAGEPWLDERRLDELLAAVERRELALYVDRGIEGWRDDRPAFNRLLADCRAGLFDLVVVDQGSRLSRHTPVKFCALVAHPLMEAGVQVESVQRGRTLDWDDIGDFILQSVEQHKGSEESRDASWRVLSDYVMLAKRGELLRGNPPFGYVRARRPDGRLYYALGDAHLVETVRWIFRAYAHEGLSLRDVAAELVRRGVPSPRGKAHWRQCTVAWMLRDPVYVGSYRWNAQSQAKYYRYQGGALVAKEKLAKRTSVRNDPADWIVVPDIHDRMIDDATWEQVQTMMTANRARTTPGQRRHDFALAGLLVCQQCGCRMTGHFPQRTGSSKRYAAVYRCASSYDAGKCDLNTVREPEVLEAVLRSIQAHISPANLDRLRQLARGAIEEALKPEQVESARRERAALEIKLGRARRNLALLDDDASVKAVAAQIAEWQGEVDRIDRQLGEAQRPGALAALDDAIREMERIVADLARLATEGEPGRLRPALARLIARVRIRTRKRCIGKNRHAYDLLPGVIELRPGTALSEKAGGLLPLLAAGYEVAPDVVAYSKPSSADPTTSQAGSWVVRWAC